METEQIIITSMTSVKINTPVTIIASHFTLTTPKYIETTPKCTQVECCL